MRTRRSSRPGRIAFAATLLTALSMSVAFAADPPPPPPPDSVFHFIGKVTIGQAACDTCARRACPGQPVVMSVSGTFGNCNEEFHGLSVLSAPGEAPVVLAEFEEHGGGCPDVPVPYFGIVTLPPERPGPHAVEVLELYRPKGGGPGSEFILSNRRISYEVGAECRQVPPPPDSLERTLTSLRIVPERRCNGDSLTLLIVKNGCPPCLHFTGLSLTKFRGIVASVNWQPACEEFACLPETLSLGLGRFAAGSFEIRVHTDVFASGLSVSFDRKLAFEVARTCDTTFGGCVRPQLPPYGMPAECSLRLPPGGRRDVLVPIQDDLRGQGVAGVEGYVATFKPFRIVDIHYAGAANGVHVSWRQDGPLSRFVIFGTTPDVVPPGTSDLLRVTVAADSLVPETITRGSLRGEIRVASGPQGEAIPMCPLPRSVPPGIPLCIDRAALGCDVNGDGHADVRDLVLMARCLRHAAGDPTDRTHCFDCDGDGTFGIPDLFCCAREILHGPGVPHDSSHVQAGLSVSMDAPTRDGDAVRVRLHVRGAASLGAALLRLRYPADRWQLQPPSNLDAGFAEGWLPLVDAGEAGLLRVGALRLGDVAADELVYELLALPLAGATPGGTLSVEGADLTTPDGALLKPATAWPSAELASAAPSAAIELSPARPNPFTRSTTFAVSLPREADVDLAVHDLAGRRVATLAHGHIGAGRASYAWDGAGARDGLYFVRLTVDGRVLSTRVALLREGR